MPQCAYCGKDNAGDAAQCAGCGTLLAVKAPAVEIPESEANPVRQAARRAMIHGGFWFFGGLLVTASTYAIASRGGTYVIAWGAVVFGAIRLVRGMVAWSHPTAQNHPTAPQPANLEDRAYRQLSFATRLEIDGKIPEMLAYYEKVIAAFPNTGAAKDAQKSLENLRANKADRVLR